MAARLWIEADSTVGYLRREARLAGALLVLPRRRVDVGPAEARGLAIGGSEPGPREYSERRRSKEREPRTG